MNFSKEEMINMVYVLGECNRNCLLARKTYAQKYPTSRHPHIFAFQRLRRRFESTGNVKYPQKQVRNSSVSNEENELRVLLSVEENPQISVRQISREIGLSKSLINRIIKSHKYHPYHISLHQELHGTDFENRVSFCNTILEKINRQPGFLDTVLFSDEATFKSNGLVNKHNMHYYSTENPRWVRHLDNQNQWSLNVWGGIINLQVIGPYFFEGRLTGLEYRRFLREELPLLLEDVDLNTRNFMWYQHDGAPPHYAREVRRHLDSWRGEKWIGRGGPTAWPARSPDLTPCDLFLWGYVKKVVYNEVPTTPEDMKERIKTAFSTIRQDVLQNVKMSVIRRSNICIQQEGRNFEHLF